MVSSRYHSIKDTNHQMLYTCKYDFLFVPFKYFVFTAKEQLSSLFVQILAHEPFPVRKIMQGDSLCYRTVPAKV